MATLVALAAVPLVSWFRVGKLVRLAAEPLVANNVAVPVGKVYTPVSSAAVKVIVWFKVKTLPVTGENPVTAAAVPPEAR